MTEQEILEGNRLIAEFLGWREEGEDHWPVKDSHYNPEGYDGFGLIGFKFYDNWQWLMPVCKKIMDMIRVENFQTVFWFNTNQYRDETYEKSVEIIGAIMSFDIERTYYAVVQFIKWYNETIKKNDGSSMSVA